MPATEPIFTSNLPIIWSLYFLTSAAVDASATTVATAAFLIVSIDEPSTLFELVFTQICDLVYSTPEFSV